MVLLSARTLENAHDASDPPAAGHDDTARHPAATVVVGPGVEAAQGLADTLAVGVTPPALRAAHTRVVEHGVKGHGALFTLKALQRERHLSKTESW